MSEPRCSFCGKGQGVVKKLIQAPGPVYICDECVAVSNEILANLDLPTGWEPKPWPMEATAGSVRFKMPVRRRPGADVPWRPRQGSVTGVKGGQLWNAE